MVEAIDLSALLRRSHLVYDRTVTYMMRNKSKWLALALLVIILAACAPAETVPDLVEIVPDLERVPGETVTPVEKIESPAPAPTETATNEPARPTATPLPTLELMPESPTKPVPQLEIVPMPESPTVVPPDDPYALDLIDKAKSDLAQRTGIEKDEIMLHEYRMVTWPDASLGCPQPGMAYAQVLVDGYLIMLRAGLGIYNYHGGGYPDRGPFLCEGGMGAKIIVPPPAGLGDT